MDREYGPNNAKKITQRYNELTNIENLGLMIKYKVGRCHSLTGNLKGKFALDIQHPLRMIIEPITSNYKELENIIAVKIVNLEDYHD
jgi:proteic killer suppression protein